MVSPLPTTPQSCLRPGHSVNFPLGQVPRTGQKSAIIAAYRHCAVRAFWYRCFHHPFTREAPDLATCGLGHDLVAICWRKYQKTVDICELLCYNSVTYGPGCRASSPRREAGSDKDPQADLWSLGMQVSWPRKAGFTMSADGVASAVCFAMGWRTWPVYQWRW